MSNGAGGATAQTRRQARRARGRAHRRRHHLPAGRRRQLHGRGARLARCRRRRVRRHRRARPAAANRRCSTSPRGCSRRRRAGSKFSARRSPASTASPDTCSSPMRCFPGRPRWRMSRSGLRPPARRATRRAERAQTWLARVGLGAFGPRYPHMLSGGQRKRVGLAQVLIRDPKILLMDEPFGPLDAQTRQIMGNLLLDLWSADRKAVLFVTHDLEEAIALSDRVVIMSAGPAARIIGDWRVPLARPRDIAEVKLDPAFHAAAPRHLADAEGRGAEGLRADGRRVIVRASSSSLCNSSSRVLAIAAVAGLAPPCRSAAHAAAAVLLLEPGRCRGPRRQMVRRGHDLEASLDHADRGDAGLRHRLGRAAC